jgi:pyruvate/2-oxoglutarate dehydrogenase complex dihydrolipoamide dehydrogenase (E3) component
MRYDLVVVGMGSGGLVAAGFAASLGLRVAAVERDRVGGDCLWTGCVPSKALLAAAKTAQHMRTADRFGLSAVEPDVDLSRVWKRIRAVQQDIADSDDNPDRYREKGVEVLIGEATLTGPHTVAVDGRTLETRFVLLCTGSTPAEPALPGLSEAGFLTSETMFTVDRPPQSLVVVGGGPIAVEMAQALNRLGVRVSLLQRGGRILPRDEPELTDLVAGVLRDEGVGLELGVLTERVTVDGGRKVVEGTQAGASRRWEAEEILVAAGRTPTVDGLGLDEVGVQTSPRGVVVDDRLRTSVKSVYAAGDVAGRFLFTHSAGYEAVLAVRNMFFPGSTKPTGLVPWATFTDPELAHVGMTTEEAREAHGGDVEVARADLAHSDRARADGTTEGRVVLVTARGRLVGAHILAPTAGEMIHEPALAIHRKMKLRDLAGMIHVYPTLTTTTNLLAAEAAYANAARLTWLTRLTPGSRGRREPRTSGTR